MAKIPSTGGGSKFEYSLVEKDTYEARIVRFVFTGVQPQRPYQGQAKPDALTAKVAYELIGETVTVTNTEDGTQETRPAIVFQDIIVPGGGTSRGKAFDIINAALGAEECFDDTEEYKALLNSPIFVKVGSYTNRKSGKDVNCVDGVGSMGKKAKDKLEDSTVDNVFFDCYSDDEGYKETYAGLGNFVQKLLKDAKDTEYIPAIKDNWPTSIEEKKEEDSGNEF